MVIAPPTSYDVASGHILMVGHDLAVAWLLPSELHRRPGRGLCLQEVPPEDSVLEKIGIGRHRAHIRNIGIHLDTLDWKESHSQFCLN